MVDRRTLSAMSSGHNNRQPANVTRVFEVFDAMSSTIFASSAVIPPRT